LVAKPSISISKSRGAEKATGSQDRGGIRSRYTQKKPGESTALVVS